MWIQLNVINTEYKTYSDILRVHGTIEQAPIDIGSHHTHLIETGDEIELESSTPFPDFDIALLYRTQQLPIVLEGLYRKIRKLFEVVKL